MHWRLHDFVLFTQVTIRIPELRKLNTEHITDEILQHASLKC